MKLKPILIAVFVGMLFCSQAGEAQSLLRNSTFARTVLNPWTTFSNTSDNWAVQASSLALTSPWDAKAAGTNLGGNFTNWRSGIYQSISGLTPGITYEIVAQGQILNGDIGSGAPTIGDDVLSLFWVNGTSTTFTSSWPGSANVLQSLTGNVSVWTTLSGTFIPSSTQVLIGFSSIFTSGNYTANSTLVDAVRVKQQGTLIWDTIYDGSALPSTAPGNNAALFVNLDNTGADQTIVAADGSEAPVGTPSFVKFLDNNAAASWDEYMPAQAFYPGNACSAVMRVRRKSGYTATGANNFLDVRNGQSRFRFRFIDNGTIHQLFYQEATTVTVDMGGLGSWQVVRVTWENGGTQALIKTYVNGSLTPTESHLGTTANANIVINTASGNNLAALGEFDLDWLCMTSDGAFAPGSGPAMPTGFTEPVAVSDWDRY